MIVKKIGFFLGIKKNVSCLKKRRKSLPPNNQPCYGTFVLPW